MKTAKYLCLLPLFLMAGNALYAGSRIFESFYIKNSSSYDVTVSMEFWYGPGSNPPPGVVMDPAAWRQTVSGITLSIVDKTILYNQTTARPGQYLEIFDYSVPGPRELFESAAALPFMYKMNAIFKSLEITHNDGRSVITLEDLARMEVQRTVLAGGIVWNVLEIFDMDDP